MQNQDANQLPGADALPDGFIDSFVEFVAPATLTPEQEKPLNDCRKNYSSEFCCAIEFQEKSGGLAAGSLLSGIEQTECNWGAPDGVCSLSEALVRELSNSEVKEQGISQSIKRSSQEHLDAITKESLMPDAADVMKTGRQENPEAKRKIGKSTFKTEKEFLELTLKYERVLAERDAALVAREKLESLSRELQRQNKILMDECNRVSVEGQNLRSGLLARFQDAIEDVNSKLEEQKDQYLGQLKENEMSRKKLKQLADQFALSEYQNEEKQKSLEHQLADLKIMQHEEKILQEQSQMILHEEQVSQSLETEKNLRPQSTADGEKFQLFQEVLLKSNEIFETFKQKAEKMAKSIKQLKEENRYLKSKCDKSDFTLIKLLDEREGFKKQLEKLKNQKDKLESLCRSLQAERKRSTPKSNSTESVTS